MAEPSSTGFREVAKPTIEEDDILIDVKHIRICGWDNCIYHGTHPYPSYPVVQGHEVSGIIIETGRDVEGG